MPTQPGETPPVVNGAASLYVNYFEVAHNQYEFLVELGQYRPGRDDAAGMVGLHTRLALSPPYAKMLSDLMARAVTEHERAHGPIPTIAESSTPFDIVLHSLPEFEERARQLRAQSRDSSIKTGDAT